MSTATVNTQVDAALNHALFNTLVELSLNPYPEIPNPEGCKKRASVALILRIRPHFNHDPPLSELVPLNPTQSTSEILSTFFAQPWVQHGDPEAIFIKRAAREGDRWTSHVALPGGKRDPEDADDKATAIREAVEEIGLDLASPDVLFVGNLPQRVISSTWGKVPLMVLCPFVFICTQPYTRPVKLQPTEVASTHWVPLRVLLSPSARTYEYVDVSDRFARQRGIVTKTLIRTVLGKMRFSAVRLTPSESVYCTSTAEFFSSSVTSETSLQTKNSLTSQLYSWYLGDHAGSLEPTRPLLLWGLTLGVLADFLDQLPPHNAVKLWSYPTFTSWDTRLIISLLSHSLKKRNKARLERSQTKNQTAVDSETEATAINSGGNPWFIGGLSPGMNCQDGENGRNGKNSKKEYAIGVILDGYYDVARRGVWVAAALRLFGTVALIVYILRRLKPRW